MLTVFAIIGFLSLFILLAMLFSLLRSLGASEAANGLVGLILIGCTAALVLTIAQV